MDQSISAVIMAAGSAVAAGAVSLAGLYWLSRRSTVWAIRLSPLVGVASVAAGVVAASATMLLEPQQARIIALVLLVSTPIAVIFGVVSGRRVADLQREAAEHAAARERDREIESRRRELIAWLSHDLRTPLARIRALTEAHEDGLAPPDYATRVAGEIDGLAVIIDDIATLSRLQSPGGSLHPQVLDVSDLVSDAVSGNQPLAHRLNLTLEAVAPGTVLAQVDPAEMGRAINNLIVNALRHTRPDGFVAVGVEPVGTRVRVVVRDQCGGIPEDHLDRLFEAGWRGTTARTPGDAGAGLGLTITERVVQAHDGTVTVANTDDGCAFTIDMPAVADKGALDVAPETTDDPVASSGSRRGS